jgi:hypothetical protein
VISGGVAALLALVVACGGSESTPTPAATARPAPTPTVAVQPIQVKAHETVPKEPDLDDPFTEEIEVILNDQFEFVEVYVTLPKGIELTSPPDPPYESQGPPLRWRFDKPRKGSLVITLYLVGRDFIRDKEKVEAKGYKALPASADVAKELVIGVKPNCSLKAVGAFRVNEQGEVEIGIHTDPPDRTIQITHFSVSFSPLLVYGEWVGPSLPPPDELEARPGPGGTLKWPEFSFSGTRSGVVRFKATQEGNGRVEMQVQAKRGNCGQHAEWAIRPAR